MNTVFVHKITGASFKGATADRQLLYSTYKCTSCTAVQYSVRVRRHNRRRNIQTNKEHKITNIGVSYRCIRTAVSSEPSCNIPINAITYVVYLVNHQKQQYC